MLIVGSDDGAYRLPEFPDPGETTAEKVLDAGRVRRVRAFDALDGVFAATTSGLYHSRDGETWTDLAVPAERVYSVGASPDGSRLFAGTRPAAVYATRSDPERALRAVDGGGETLRWTELDGFRELPSREDWGLPRHENLAQVRDVHVHRDAPDRVVAGVEVGGVHASEDGGETWSERRGAVDGGPAPGDEGDSDADVHGDGDGGERDWSERPGEVHDDVHELRLATAETWVAATGYGLYVTRDAGASWERSDEGVEQRYFRSVFVDEGDVYAGAALSNSSTWEDEGADPLLCVSRDGGPLAAADLPAAAGTPTGFAAVDGDVAVGTHRGSLFVEDGGDWTDAGSFPTPGDVVGRYTPLAWVEE